MADEVRLAKADLKRPTAAVPVTMHGLWRLVVWGSTAATALLIAVLSSRGVVGSQRAAVAASTLPRRRRRRHPTRANAAAGSRALI